MRWPRVNGPSVSDTIELAPHLRKHLGELGLAAVVELDGVQNGPRPLPERGSGIAVVPVSGDVLPVRHDNDPQLELRFRDVVHAPPTARRVPRTSRDRASRWAAVGTLNG